MMDNNFIGNYLLEKPITSVFLLVLVCAFFRIIDIFILRLDEPPVNEIILSKTLGLLLLFLYVKTVYSRFGEIGYNTHHILKNIYISLVFVFLAIILIYGSQFIYLLIKGAKPRLYFQHYTLFALIVSVIAGNIINALMEEGLFRGLMIAQYISYTTFWKANILQAAIFGIWHIVWPLKDYYSGNVKSIGTFAVMILGNIIITFLMGLTMGYLFYKTGNLWTAFSWHFLMNLVQNILIVKSRIPGIDTAVMNTSYTAVKGFSFMIAFIIINLLINHLKPLK